VFPLSSKKLPSEISVDDLLSELEDDSAVAPIEDQTDNEIVRFLTYYNIERGNEPVKLNLLYRLYKLFSPNPKGAEPFNAEVRLYFDYEEKPNHYNVFLNKSALNIGETLYKAIRKSHKPKTRSRSFRKHFELFLKELNMKPGTFYLDSTSLLYLYDEWKFKTKRKYKVADRQFLSVLKLYFTPKRTSKTQQLYGIDRNALNYDLTDEKVASIKEWSKKYHEKRQARKKKPKEVSSARPNRKSEKPI
jgi:hypothetical protein